MEDALTDEELDWLCCDAFTYEASADDIDYDSGIVTVNAGEPVECIQ